MANDWMPPAMPSAVKAARVLLYGVAGLAVMLFAALSIAGFAAAEVGGLAGIPLVLGSAGAVLGWRLGPGRHRVRIALNVIEGAWTVLSFGASGQGDPTGPVTLAFSVAVLVLVNTRSSRDYLHRTVAVTGEF